MKTKVPRKSPASSAKRPATPSRLIAPPRLVLVFLSSKGGVGKTTTAINVAMALLRRGQPVTLIDCDPQATASKFFGRYEVTLFDVLTRRVAVNAASTPVGAPAASGIAINGIAVNSEPASTQVPGAGLHLVPASRLLDDVPLSGWMQLAPLCECLASQGRLVLVDTPAGWHGETKAAAAVATHCVVPVTPEIGAFESALETLDLLQRLSTPPPAFLLKTMWRENAISRLLAAQRGDWLPTPVPRRECMNALALQSQSVFDARASLSMQAVFESLADDLACAMKLSGPSREQGEAQRGSQ